MLISESDSTRKRIILVTGHHIASKRRANFHWLADAYVRAGFEVVFFTCWISWISRLVGDPRFHYFQPDMIKKLVWVREHLGSYVWLTPWHPFTLPWQPLNLLTSPIFNHYPKFPLGEIIPFIQGCSHFIFESTPGLMLFPIFKNLNPIAKTIYRVSDPLALVNLHPVVLEAERIWAPAFDLISTTSEYSLRQFSSLANCHLHYHGLEKTLFDIEMPNPYPPDSINVLFVGNFNLDVDFLMHAANLFPQWLFHIIGPLKNLPRLSNIIAYGEIPFQQTISFIQHADIGLQTRSYSQDAEHFTNSLKVVQYTYCRLPIVAPEFLRTAQQHFFYYRPGDSDSIRQALLQARAFDRTRISRDMIQSWDEVMKSIETDLADTTLAGSKRLRNTSA